MGFATSLAYTAAKHEVLGLTQAALEYSAWGVLVAAKSGSTRGVAFVRAGDLCGDLLLSGGWRPIIFGGSAQLGRSTVLNFFTDRTTRPDVLRASNG